MPARTWGRVLVTGASSGIGKAFAGLLAARGSDVVMVARDAQRLSELADRLASDHGVTAEVLPADLTDPGELEPVARRIDSKTDPVDLVVNNAGMGISASLWEAGPDVATMQVDLNVRALVRLTHAAVTSMGARGTGGIVNVASTAGFFPGPGGAVYSAGKAFVINFGLGLAEELRRAGSPVEISTLCPGFTRTEFQARGGFETSGVPEVFWHDADEVARQGLDALESGRTLCIPGIHNRVVALAAQAAPRTLQARVITSLSQGLGA